MGEDLYSRRLTLAGQHGDNLFRRGIAKQLSQRLFVVSDAMPFDQRDEIPLCIPAQRRYTEMRVGTYKPRRFRIEVREVAAPTTRHQDLLADLVRAFHHKRASAALSGGNRAHQAGGSPANNDYVGIFHAARIAV